MKMNILNPPRCGTCHFAKLVPNDFLRRVCFGAPPSAQQVPTGAGSQHMTVRMIRPIVGVADDACALYRGKSAEQIDADGEAMQAVQTAAAETKQ